jgi:hypothetical protein
MQPGSRWYEAWPFWILGLLAVLASRLPFWASLAERITSRAPPPDRPEFVHALVSQPYITALLEKMFRLPLLVSGIALFVVPALGLWVARRAWWEGGWGGRGAAAKAAALYLFVLLLLLFSHFGIHQNVAISPDEHLYLYQGELFSTFRLYVEAHEEPEFFKYAFVATHEGKEFSIFPPGFAMVLAAGYWLRIPSILPVLIAALAPVLVFLLMARLGRPKTGFFAAALLALSPYFFIMGGTFFSHPLSLVLVLLFAHLVAGISERTGPLKYLLLGLLGSFVALVHHLDVAALAPFGVLLLARLWQTSAHRIRSLVLLAAGGLLVAALELAYHWAILGDPLGQPYIVYCGQGNYLADILEDADLFHPLEAGALKKGLGLMMTRLAVLNLVLFPMGLLLALPWFLGRKHPVEWCMLFAVLFTLAVYVAYKPEGGWELGPRYYFHLAGFLAIAVAEGLMWMDRRLARALPRRGRGLVTGLVLLGISLNAGIVAGRALYIRTFADVLRVPYRLVEEQGVEKALVFIDVKGLPRSFNWGNYFWTRNRPDRDGPVVFANDLGERDHALAADFSGYEPFRLEIDLARFGCDDFKPRLDPLRRANERPFPGTET